MLVLHGLQPCIQHSCLLQLCHSCTNCANQDANNSSFGLDLHQTVSDDAQIWVANGCNAQSHTTSIVNE